MRKCMFCGGIIGVDCFNPNRCARREEESSRPIPELESDDNDATELEEE